MRGGKPAKKLKLIEKVATYNRLYCIDIIGYFTMFLNTAYT